MTLCLHRLWTLEREDTVLSTPPTVKGNYSTDLEILLFVSVLMMLPWSESPVVIVFLQMMTIALL